jgi:hypothetical protein
MYAKTGYGPGNIAALTSGAALSYGPTISSNDPRSAMSVGGSSGAYAISPMSGMGGCGCGAVRGHAPVPMRGLGGLFGLGVCDAGCQSWVKWGLIGVAIMFGVSYLHDRASASR